MANPDVKPQDPRFSDLTDVGVLIPSGGTRAPLRGALIRADRIAALEGHLMMLHGRVRDERLSELTQIGVLWPTGMAALCTCSMVMIRTVDVDEFRMFLAGLDERRAEQPADAA